ncbi:MAG: hypothetical protein KGO96_03790 [Elusimicrobia bacterium]|nr:hypothetical protein [Elusimicrobiota bacterium]MDE2237388.1 hypothetical protein [Elusimicrobiota bacterium]MDE2425015.1 hypothetical protein [Elusimicrobiota bacterium]
MLGRALGLIAVCVLAVGAAAQGEGSCVRCHAHIKGASPASHNFADWRKSAHARSGVGCQSCHGGDAAARDEASAHAGMLPSTDPRSAVYFTRVPQTCGACHQPEFEAFRKSAHFKELESSGRGPNCVTCHGAMANYVLGPREMETTCTLCHRQPTHAYAARLELRQSEAMTRSLEAALRRASGASDLSAQRKEYEAIVDLQRSAMVQWHTFQMDRVLASAKQVERRVTTVLGELRVKTH